MLVLWETERVIYKAGYFRQTMLKPDFFKHVYLAEVQNWPEMMVLGSKAS